MSLKTIVQNTLMRVGLPSPDFVVNSADDGVRQVRSLVNQEGTALAQRHNWQALIRQQQFVATRSDVQTGAVPPDFSRFVNNTFFNRSRNCEVRGPLNPHDWQECKRTGSFSACQLHRMRGNDVMICPMPRQGENFSFEYVSNNWVADGKSAMTADDDKALLDEELITLGTTWRYLQAKGMDYGQAFQDYEIRLANMIARDGGVRDLDFRNASSRTRPIRNVVRS